MHRVFFDVTDLRVYLTKTERLSGIQRVVVMVIEEAVRALGADRVYMSYADMQAGSYRALPCTAIGDGRGLSQDVLRGLLGVAPVEANVNRPTLGKYAKKPLKRWFHGAIREANARIGNRRHFEKRYTTLEAWRASASPQAVAASGKTAEFFSVAQPGDHLVLMDASWGKTLAERACRKAHDAGLKVHSLVHDLIPLVRPDFIGLPEHPLIFHKWLHSSLDYVDRFIANSNATARDLNGFLHTYARPTPVDVVPLAQAGVPTQIAKHDDPQSLLAVDRGTYGMLHDGFHLSAGVRTAVRRPYVLCVGTMELRKNLWSIAQVWDRLRVRGDIELPRLVFAGRAGQLNDDFNRMIERTGHLYGWVDILHGPSDEELDYLYRHCLFTINTSYIEGWGLPVGESLSYGKTGVVSNTSSLPEVGGDMVEYCDPMSIGSIEAACLRLIAEPEHRAALEAQIARTRLRSWQDVATDLLATLDL
jgi:glycosyltransferase involved in cell wall biosynthesis